MYVQCPLGLVLGIVQPSGFNGCHTGRNPTPKVGHLTSLASRKKRPLPASIRYLRVSTQPFLFHPQAYPAIFYHHRHHPPSPPTAPGVIVPMMAPSCISRSILDTPIIPNNRVSGQVPLIREWGYLLSGRLYTFGVWSLPSGLLPGSSFQLFLTSFRH